MLPGTVTQDTIRPGIVIRIDPGKLIPDSVFKRLDEVPDHIRIADSVRKAQKVRSLTEKPVADTTSLSRKSFLATFWYSDSSSKTINPFSELTRQFPFQPVRKEVIPATGNAMVIIRPLKEGMALPVKPLHSDWITSLILLAALLWLTIKLTTKSILPEFRKFILFRGINESSSRDISSLFYWQSTVLNLVSFLALALFIYCSVSIKGLVPQGFAQPLFFPILIGIIIIGITSRHLICIATGNLSGQKEIFNEYLLTVYQSYRFSSIIIYLLTILMLYSTAGPSMTFINIGILILGFFYLLRIFRLFLIFLKRNISLLYLFLYLCCLEILPILIISKYLSGLWVS